MGRSLLLLLAPLLLLGPALLPGARFLPQLPVGFEPLASEHPDAAVEAWIDANLVTSDRLFPILTDELAIRRELGAGRLPLWEPDFGMGAPLAAGTVVGPWYPPNWLRYALGPAAAGGWLALLSLYLAGLGACLFFERLGLAFGAAAVGAVGYQVAGFAAVNLHYVMKVDAALWLPWALWSIEGLITGKPRAGLALTLSIALALLAGFPQIGVFTAAAAGLYALGRALELRAAAPLARALVFVLLGVGAAAVQLLPMAQASAFGVRQPQSAAALWPQRLPAITTWSIPLQRLFFGPGADDQRAHEVAEGVALAAPGYVNPLEWTLGGGLSLTMLALLGVALHGRRARIPLALGLLALGFAPGWPVIRWLYYLPGAGLGAPGRAASVLWLCVPWLAALTVDGLLRGRRAAANVLIVLGAPLCLATWPLPGGGAPIQFFGLPDWFASALWLSPGPLLAGAAALHAARLAPAASAVSGASAASGPGGGARSRGWLALAAVVLVSGWWDNRVHLAPRGPSALEPGLLPASAAMDAIRDAAGDGRVLRFDASESGIDDVLVLARPNLPHAYGIADLTPYVVFTNARLVQLFEALDPRTRFRSGFSRVADPAHLGHPVLDLARVTCVLSRRPLEHPRLEEVHRILDRSGEVSGLFVYRRSGALPIARGVPAPVIVESDSTAVGMLARGAVPLDERTVLTEREARKLPEALRLDGAGPAEPGRIRVLRVERPSPGRLDVEVEAGGPGLVAFTEAWMPGWKASIDGREVPVVRTDHVARAVPVPAGRSVVRTRYAPPSLALGLGLSLASLALSAALSVSRRPRARVAPD